MDVTIEQLISLAKVLREFKFTLFAGHDWETTITEIVEKILETMCQIGADKHKDISETNEEVGRICDSIKHTIKELKKGNKEAIAEYMKNTEQLVEELEHTKKEWQNEI